MLKLCVHTLLLHIPFITHVIRLDDLVKQNVYTNQQTSVLYLHVYIQTAVKEIQKYFQWKVVS